ncbi:Lysophospholipase, alpha-beta hydrolase superfamily [Gilliamella bombicola]|uniref:Lysophospholipase, alpha-beta hydrolase superfamily n=1 Tax=Gilliamella bombicola TaxID=1798182 RepID=A0A1C4ABH0_9GAMM|nr:MULTISPECIES: bifunctional alpha/beta hydrolase/class I SAM-dependent methyltransferase [Gilliamella]NUF27198.1 alpha/beta fold hydrolase [Gilliamella sp. ESL0254]SCB91982.1 Lysophospholipase, alpha-beta hydrolase superfamily [Gilliamella bombicola]
MRQQQQKTFISHDGCQLFYRYWPAVDSNTDLSKAIVLFHRGHEHSGRMAHLAEELELPDYQIFAWDARGNGKSEGERGDAPNFATLIKDANCFIEHIIHEYGLNQEDIAIIAQSVGAVIASAWVHDYVPNIRALILGSPAFSVKLYVPLAVPGLKLLYNLKGNFFVNSYVKPKLLTHDTERAESFTQDSLITRPISVRLLLDLYAVSDRIVKDANAIRVPTQLLVSGSDYVVRRKPQKQFYDNLGTEQKEFHILPDFYHDTFGEKDRKFAIERARRFIVGCFANELSTPSLVNADRVGYTRQEADNLTMPPSGWIKPLYWKFIKANLKYASKLSDGIKLGFDTGFDSGSTLDYVYRNEPSGTSKLGRFFDYIYLQSIGWRGIRQRKAHLEELLKLAINKLYEHNRSVDIVDIAAGHGRYILETVNQITNKPNSVLLRDYSDMNVQQGQALIAEKGLANIARFEKGDAFSREQLTQLSPNPTLAVVSGLYELFSDNQLLCDSLSGLAESIPEGGYLIYTNQPWHPQLEFIARALTSHRDGQSWIMRRRTQLEMDQLVAAAGFKKITMRIDQWGIFTVSLAQRIK